MKYLNFEATNLQKWKSIFDEVVRFFEKWRISLIRRPINLKMKEYVNT